MNAMIITQKWRCGNPDCGISQAVHMLEGSLKHTQKCKVYSVYLDEYMHITGQNCIKQIEKELCQHDIDFILLDLAGLPTLTNPSVIDILKLKNKFGFYLYTTWWDTAQGGIVTYFNDYADISNKLFFLDSPRYINACKYPDKVIYDPFVVDPVLFSDIGLLRDIDISFNGGIWELPERINPFRLLCKSGINIQKYGGLHEQWLDWPEYANIYQRSKMTYNTSIILGNTPQFKGRIIEAMCCGAALLDYDNEILREFLIPMQDYIAYNSDNDLVDKVKYYLNHLDELEQIRISGRDKIQKLCDPNRWWTQNVFSDI